jgi:hypothetical protein
MRSQTRGAMASPKSPRKFLFKVAYLIIAVPAILLFFGLIIGIPD